MAGSRSLGSLTVDLIARTFGFEQGMDRAARIADKRMKEIERRAKIAGAVVGAAFVAGTALLARGINTAIDRMDEMSKAAQRAQLPTEQFSQLAYAANLADVSMQDITTSMGRLARAQADAMRGSKEQEGAFKRLGIEFSNADGTLRNSRDVFLDFADAYRKFQGSPEILATGMQIFGRSFQNLIPLLKDGREGLQAAADEADRFGATISTEAGQQAEAFNDNISRLKIALDGLYNGIARDILPVLTETSNRFQQLVQDGDLVQNAVVLISTALKSGIWIIEQYNNAVERTSIAMETAANSASGFAEVVRNMGIGGLFAEGSVKNGMEQISNAFEQGQAQLDALIARQQESRRLAGLPTERRTFHVPFKPPAITPPTGGGGRSGADRSAQEALREQQRAREELRRQIEAVQGARREFEGWAAQLAGPVADANYQFARDMERLNDLAREGEIAA